MFDGIWHTWCGRMMTVLRASERTHEPIQNGAVWHSPAMPPAPAASNGAASQEALLDELVLEPGARVPPATEPFAECVTYVCEGALQIGDTAQTDLSLPGEFHRRGPRDESTNRAGPRGARLFCLWLPTRSVSEERPAEHQRFSVAERRGRLRLVASGDGAQGSLHLDQDTRFFSSALEGGTHLAHVVAPGRFAWLHVVAGVVVVNQVELVEGDAASATGFAAISLIAQSRGETLLVDRGPPRDVRS